MWPLCSRPATLIAARQPGPASIPRFQKVTFQQGAIWRSRFAPDGQTVVYAMVSAGDDLKPAELFSTRVGSLDSRSLGLPPADILSISRSGEMALGLLRIRESLGGWNARRSLSLRRNASSDPRRRHGRRLVAGR